MDKQIESEREGRFERERELGGCFSLHIYIYIFNYSHIYIYIYAGWARLILPSALTGGLNAGEWHHCLHLANEGTASCWWGGVVGCRYGYWCNRSGPEKGGLKILIHPFYDRSRPITLRTELAINLIQSDSVCMSYKHFFFLLLS